MSSKASIQNFMAGEKLTYTNATNRPIELVFKTAAGTSVRTTAGVGQSVEFSVGQERATLYVLEREKTNEKFQVVRSR